jgi:hypothetical protein
MVALQMAVMKLSSYILTIINYTFKNKILKPFCIKANTDTLTDWHKKSPPFLVEIFISTAHYFLVNKNS